MSKSSKSPAGLIRLIDSPEAIRSKITCATTDSGCDIRSSPDKPGISNLIAIYTLVSGAGPEHIESTCSGNTYADFKSDLADKLVEYLRPFRERFEQLSHERGYVERILLEGSDRAQATAIRTLADVYERVGFLDVRPA